MTHSTSALPHQESAPAWATRLFRLQSYLTEDFGGGPRQLKMAWVINFHKFITLFLILGMMFYFDNFSTTAWVYLALHGTYGYCWLIKDFAFRDSNFEARVTYPGAVMTYIGLVAWYWLLPYFVISGHIEHGNLMLWFCVTLHTLGIALMLAADLQKNITLRFRRGLITNGVFAYTRNPNYLGEIMIYASYALMAQHWLGWAVVLYSWIGFFLVRMLIKDASISRHPGWAEYKARSGLLIPWDIIFGKAISGGADKTVSATQYEGGQ